MRGQRQGLSGPLCSEPLLSCDLTGKGADGEPALHEGGGGLLRESPEYTLGVLIPSARCVLGRPGHSALRIVHLILTMALEICLTTTILSVQKSYMADALAHGCTSWAGST